MSRSHPHKYDLVNRHKAWFKKLSAYTGYTWPEYIEMYQWERELFNETVTRNPREAFTQTAWCLLRQPFYHRKSTWWDVSHKIPHAGSVLDWGCGTGEMLVWLRNRRGVTVHGYDLPSPHFDYARHRLGTFVLTDAYDVVVCQETLEHVDDCVETVQKLMGRVKPGGVLMWDFIDAYDGGANCASPAARKEVLHLLAAVNDGQREVWRKPRG